MRVNQCCYHLGDLCLTVQVDLESLLQLTLIVGDRSGQCSETQSILLEYSPVGSYHGHCHDSVWKPLIIPNSYYSGTDYDP